MSRAEAVSLGAGTTEQLAEQAAVRDIVTSPPRPADAELTLRSMDIYLPDSPLSVNGQAFRINVDEEKLAAAVNAVAENYEGRRDFYPKQLVVELVPGQSTVELGEDLQPKITNPGESEEPPVLSPFKGGGTAINITLPGELASTEYSEAGLVELLTRHANKDLLVALGQNLKAQKRFHVSLRVSGLAIGVAAGEGAGIALSEDTLQMLGRGTGGALVGGAVVVGGMFALDRARWGDIKNLPAWAVRKSRNFQKVHWQLEKTAKAGPIISLEAIPVEEVSENTG